MDWVIKMMFGMSREIIQIGWHDVFLDNVGGQEDFSFTDGFSRYDQIRIVMEDIRKITFVIEWLL